MTAERLAVLLRQPTLLRAQRVTELDELIAHYPWCGVLRKLRLQYALLNGDDDEADRLTKRCAPYVEASEIGRIRRETTALPPTADAPSFIQFEGGLPDNNNSAGSPEMALATDALQIGAAKGDLILYAKASSLRKITKVVTCSGPKDVQDEGDTLAAPQAKQSDYLHRCIAVGSSALASADQFLFAHNHIMEHGRPEPSPKENFASYRRWKKQPEVRPWSSFLELDPDEFADAPTADKRRLPAIRPAAASETLADLLASQGYTDRAKLMYEQLILRYPERKATFAARIQAL